MKAKTKSNPDKLDAFEQSILDTLDFKKLKHPTHARQKKFTILPNSHCEM
jgi:hypothetical protein